MQGSPRRRWSARRSPRADGRRRRAIRGVKMRTVNALTGSRRGRERHSVNTKGTRNHETETRRKRARWKSQSQPQIAVSVTVATPAERGPPEPSETQRRRQGGHTEKDVPHARRPAASWESCVRMVLFITYFTWSSQEGSDPSTNQAQPCSASAIARDRRRPRRHGCGGAARWYQIKEISEQRMLTGLDADNFTLNKRAK